MEHVVFWSAAPGEPSFARLPNLGAAVELVGQLVNDYGISDATVHSLTEVPLAIRAHYVVEVGDGAAPEPTATPFTVLTQAQPTTSASPFIHEAAAEPFGSSVPTLQPEPSPFRAVSEVAAATTDQADHSDTIGIGSARLRDLAVEASESTHPPVLSVVPDESQPADEAEESETTPAPAVSAFEQPAFEQPAFGQPAFEPAAAEVGSVELLATEPSTRSLGLFA